MNCERDDDCIIILNQDYLSKVNKVKQLVGVNNIVLINKIN